MLYATLASLCFLAAPVPPSEGSIEWKVDQFVHQEMTRQHIPGIALAVVQNGQAAMSKGYGIANIEQCTPVQAHSIFQSGSIGKQFTAAAIMLLVERGALGLDDPIARHLPAPSARWRSITVRHLLTHTSGIPDNESVLNYWRDYTDRELIAVAGSLRRTHRPGQRFEYSNAGYMLLGMIIGRVSGRFYGDLLREHIFLPLGMHTARVISEEDIVFNRVAGYRLVAGRIKNQEWVSPSLNRTAEGSIYVSLLDMQAWERGVRSRAVLSARSWSKIFEAVTLSNGQKYPYGFGWSLDSRNGHAVQYHDGSWQGFESILIRYIRDDVTIIVLANLADANLERIVDGIIALVNDAASRSVMPFVRD